MSTESFVVPPLSRKDIRAYADDLRKRFRIEKPLFPIVEVIELVMPRVIPGFFVDICDEIEMTERFGRGCHGMTFPMER